MQQPYQESSGVREGASCGVRKAAIPVAGYPLGFVKNPNLHDLLRRQGRVLISRD